jgi:hypothetical protein
VDSFAAGFRLSEKATFVFFREILESIREKKENSGDRSRRLSVNDLNRFARTSVKIVVGTRSARLAFR